MIFFGTVCQNRFPWSRHHVSKKRCGHRWTHDLSINGMCQLGDAQVAVSKKYPSSQTLLDPHMQGSDPHMEGSGPSNPYGFEGPVGLFGVSGFIQIGVFPSAFASFRINHLTTEPARPDRKGDETSRVDTSSRR